MLILLDKPVGDLSYPTIKSVRRIQRTAISFAKIVSKGCCLRELSTAKTVDSLPVIANGKQRSLRILPT